MVKIIMIRPTSPFYVFAAVILLAHFPVTTSRTLGDSFICHYSWSPLDRECYQDDEPIIDICNVIDGCLVEKTNIFCPECLTKKETYSCSNRGCVETTPQNCSYTCNLYRYYYFGDQCTPCNPIIVGKEPPLLVFHCPLPVTPRCRDCAIEACRDVKPVDCYWSIYRELCCGTCMLYATGPPGCEYGDKQLLCKFARGEQCDSLQDSCCQTCSLQSLNDLTFTE